VVRSTGSVTERPWGLVLAELGRAGFTGLVTLTSDAKQFTISFDLGAIVAATSPLASDAAARIALTNHFISSSHVAELSRRIAAAADRDEIEVLAEAARLSSEQVERLRQRLVAQRAARTFSVEHGTYVIEQKIAMPPGTSLDVRAVIYQGARKNLSEQQMASALRVFGSHFVIRPDAVTSLSSYGFADEEKPIVAALLAGTSLPELEATHREIDPRTSQAVVYALAAYGACDAEHRSVPPPLTRTVTADLPPPRPSPPREGASYVIARTATSPVIARTVTPTPSSFGPSGAPTGGRPPTSPPSPAVARTATPAQPAVARTATPVRPVVARTATPITGARGRPTTSPAISRTSTARRTQALIAARMILVEQGADHFALLGVPFDAPVDVVQTAYLNLVRQLHPDKLAELGISDPNAQRLFAQVGIAFSTLTDPARRAAYLEQLARPTSQLALPRTRTSEEPPATPAAEAYRRGEAALRRDDPHDAVIELLRACQLEPGNVDYHAMLGWAQFCAATDKVSIATETKKSLERAIQKSHKPLVARFLLGRVERMLGRDREALRHFHEVLDHQPHHAEAASEVRAIQARLAAAAARRR